MNRRRSILVLVAVVLVLAVIGAFAARHQARRFVGYFAERIVLSRLPAPDEATRERAKNVLLISVDTLRKSELGLYDPSLRTTPQLDRRKAEFVRFDHAISQAPWTGPSHLALFYARRPPVAFWEWNVLSLTQVLRHYGYATAAFTDGGWLGRGGGIDAGFDHLDSPTNHGGFQQPLDDKFEQVRRWLEGDLEQPFFLFVHTYHVHIDYDPAPEDLAAVYDETYEGKLTGVARQVKEFNQEVLAGERPEVDPADVEYLRALYRAEIHEADEFLGRLFAELERLGLWRDLLVVLIGDHGESFLDHGFFEHGTGLYDELINVPLIIKPPAGQEVSARVVERQVELLDIPPTILDMVGIPIPAEFEGQSFVSLFSAGSATPYDKRYALSAVAETRNYGDAKQSVRTSKWKYIFHPASGREELYDLERDPGEDDNVVDAHRDVAAKLRTFLQDPSLIEKLESPTAPMVGPEDREILKELGYIE